MTDKLHHNCRMAIRTALTAVAKAASTLTRPAMLSNGLLTRASGSFLTDGVSAGDEVLLAGWAQPGNNGLCYVDSLSDLTLQLRLPEGSVRVFATETAPGTVTLTAGLPVGQSDENTKYVPTLNQPWFRESYKRGPETRLTVGPRARVRLDGLYMLTIFYPGNTGTSGADGMSDAVRAILYPGVVLTYAGQTLTIVSCSAMGGTTEPEWLGVPMAVRFKAYTLTPQ